MSEPQLQSHVVHIDARHQLLEVVDVSAIVDDRDSCDTELASLSAMPAFMIGIHGTSPTSR